MNIGDTNEKLFEVNETNTAAALGSGALPVFGTPYMIAMMENVSADYLNRFITPEQSTVGTLVNVSHVSASPIGMKIRVTAELTGISANGKMFDFAVKAYDEAGLIGEGTHQRAIINIEKFMARTQAKLGK